jgi:hypothetical protein
LGTEINPEVKTNGGINRRITNSSKFYQIIQETLRKREKNTKTTILNQYLHLTPKHEPLQKIIKINPHNGYEIFRSAER